MTSNGWTIYYNPKCGTCRKTLDLLKSKGVEPRIVEYLKTPPTVAEIESIVVKLKMPALAMMREKEAVFDELGLGSGKKSDKELIRAMAENPILIQRPIVVHESHAVIARPPENVLPLFK